MNPIGCIILYGLTLLYFSGAVPYKPTEPDTLSNDYVKNTMRHAKAAEMASFMNKTVDPCDDFYQFSCGNWAVLNKASLTKLTTGLFERLSEGFDRKLRVVLNEANRNKNNESPVDTLVRNFYKSCMQIKEIDEALQEGFKSIVEEFGSMPVLQGNNWSEAGFNWVDTVSKIANYYGVQVLMGVEVTKDFANNKVHAVYIGEQEFPLETRSMYLGNHTAVYRRNYKNIIATNLKNFLGVEEKLAVETAQELLDFEVQLAHGLVSETEDFNLAELSKKMTLTEMQRLYAPDIDVVRLVNGTLGVLVENVYNYNPQFQENLIKVLSRTPKRIVANYIFYRLLTEFSFKPGKTEKEKEDKCITETKKHFAKILDNLVYRSYNTNATSSDVETIWTELKTVFKLKLQTDTSLNWINSQTRDYAIEKLDKMTLTINSYDLKELVEEFKNLYIHENNFILNLREIKRHDAFEKRDQLNKPVKPLDDAMLSTSPANVLMENTIKIPVALLQPYFLWGASYPSAIKFGTLASFIAHELIHGFDNDGRDYDAAGNVKNWWDEQSTANFVERQNCFKQQYSKYSYYGKQLPESNEQAENIADNGGLRLGFAAYRRWLQAQLEAGKDINQLESERLPLFDYSNMQLFFISYAQLWCNDVVAEARSLQVATDEHVPGQFRVVGPLSNFEEFAKAFNCQKGTRMNPIQKCQIY